MDEEETKCPECEAGAPAWVMTFADLMSLLMTFFVLLLSFSEMDIQKYKQIAGSMKDAFGVQREIKTKEPPKGTSIIAQEFSPGRPQPTVINEVRQKTMDDNKQTLQFTEGKKLAEEEAEALEKALEGEINEGLIEIIAMEDEVLIRIREKGSFSSGSAALSPTFYPVLDRIGDVVKDFEGEVVVAGHTDNVPISTRQFSSNWALSSARATNVVHYLTTKAGVLPERIEIRAHADSRPLESNDSWEGRSKNRRVEIILKNSEQAAEVLSSMPSESPSESLPDETQAPTEPPVESP